MVRCSAHSSIGQPTVRSSRLALMRSLAHSCAGLHRMLKGTPVERLKLLFDILDSDSDGYITYSEVFPRGGRSVQPSMDTCLPACMHA